MARLVDKVIHLDEIIVRCLIRSYLNKPRTTIVSSALEPRVDENDLSLLRLDYTDIGFCVNHGRSLTQRAEDFSGLLYLTSTIVEGMNQWARSSISAEEIDGKRSQNGISSEIVYSPMDKNQNYLPTDIDVFAEDVSKGDFPMHADLRFNERVVTGGQSVEVNTRIRKYARMMIGRVKYQLASPPNYTDLGTMIQEDVFNYFNSRPVLTIVVHFCYASKYLTRFTNSLLPQVKGKPVEVIYINNDDLDAYKKIEPLLVNYQREVFVYGQKRTGVAKVRNRGLELARGNYVWLVEGDDVICDGAVDTVLRVISRGQNDVYMFGLKEFKADGSPKEETRILFEGPGINETTGIDVLRGRYSYSPVQMCVFRREFLNLNGMRFTECLSTDLELMPRLLLKAEHVVQAPEVTYHYFHHTDTCFKSEYSVRRTSDILSIIDRYQEMIDRMEDGNEKKALYVSQFRLLRHVICDPKRIDYLNNRKRWKINKRMPLFRKILRNSVSFVETRGDRLKWLVWYISPTLYKWFEKRDEYHQ